MKLSSFFAYLDAGTGSLVLQAIGGAFIAALVFFKNIGHRIRAIFSFGKSKKTKDNNHK